MLQVSSIKYYYYFKFNVTYNEVGYTTRAFARKNS